MGRHHEASGAHNMAGLEKVIVFHSEGFRVEHAPDIGQQELETCKSYAEDLRTLGSELLKYATHMICSKPISEIQDNYCI